MILLSCDLETTGLDRAMDRPIEVGAILYTTGQKRTLESSAYLVKSDVAVTPFITGLTGITQAALDRFGYESKDALEAFLDLAAQCDAYVGQNIKRFDKPFFENWCTRHGLVLPNKLWIDTCTDLPNVEKKTLTLMAAEAKDPVSGRACGFVNLNPHSALSDCETVLKLVEMHDINKIVERAQSPEVVLVAHQAFENNAQAKERKFRWHSEYRIWWKIVKQLEVDEEVKAAPFDISKAGPNIDIIKLWYD